MATEANPFLGTTLRVACGQVVRAEDLVPPDAWSQSGMGKAIGRSTGARFGVGINLTPPSYGIGALSLFRDRTAGPFAAADPVSAEGLAPHVVRAARLTNRLSKLEARARQRLACEALESFVVPVFITAPDGQVQFVNAAARAAAATRDGVLIVRSHLETLDPRETATLRRLIQGAARARKQHYSTAGGSEKSPAAPDDSGTGEPD